jgi:hypothetical protein
LANTIGRQQSDLSTWELLDHDLDSNGKPRSVELAR